MFKNFDEIVVGDYASINKVITDNDVRKFVEMTGDDNPLHVDSKYAESTSFKDVVVHGMLGASYISTVIGTKLPGTGALWVSQNFDFLLPVRLGDKLIISCTVLKKYDRERLLELETNIINQNGQTVLTGIGKVKVLTINRMEEKSKVNPELKGAIVTGGSGGIGKAISYRLAQDGYGVIIAYREREERANSVVADICSKGYKAISVCADISTKEGVEKIYRESVTKFGGVSVIVNNASSSIDPKNFDLLEWDDIQRQMDVQLKGAFMLSKVCVPKMIEQKWGRIINITSQVVKDHPTLNWTSYALAKTSLAKFSQYLALELGPKGITVNCVSPGMCDAGLIGNISEKMQLIVARKTPVRKLTAPEDVAATVAFLVSNEAEQITGQSIQVNGGILMS